MTHERDHRGHVHPSNCGEPCDGDGAAASFSEWFVTVATRTSLPFCDGWNEMDPRPLATRRTSERSASEAYGKTLRGPPPLCPTGIQFSDDSQLLYVHDREHLHAWTVPGLRDHECRKLAVEEQGYCRFLNDHKRIMLIGSDHKSEEGLHHVAIRDLHDDTVMASGDIRLKRYGLFAMLFNERDDQLLLQDYGQTGYFFDTTSLKQIRKIKLRHMRGIIYSPDESELWTAGGGGGMPHRDDLSTFDVKTGKRLWRQHLESSQFLRALHLVPDKTELLVACDKTLSVLDAESWDVKQVVQFPVQCESLHLEPAFSPNSELLALSGGSLNSHSIYFINCRTWELIDELKPDDGCWAVRFLTFSPDGKCLAAASWDGIDEVKLWDVSKVYQGG